jgi:phage tail-like protein
MFLETVRKVTNPSFRFVVEVNGSAAGAFTECALPSVAWEMKEVKEGGLNNYVHQLPGVRQKASLTLHNGVGTTSLVQWFLKTMNQEYERKTIAVRLLEGKDKTAIATWTIANALPTKWSGPSLKSSENSIAIQTLEFSCGEITVSTTD